MYCAPADIRENLGGGDGTGSGTASVMTDTALNAAIAQASTKVSAYTGTDWETDAATPVVVVPPLVVTVTIQLATFYATLVYRKGKDLSAFDPVVMGYNDAIKTLTDIATGRISVDPTPPGDPEPSAGHVVNTLPRIFVGADSGTVRNGFGGISPAGAPGSVLGEPGSW
jgi:phage gp36-like protein